MHRQYAALDRQTARQHGGRSITPSSLAWLPPIPSPTSRASDPTTPQSALPRHPRRAAPMPSKRPSPSAMDAGAAAASPSPPRSKKRSSRPNHRMDNDRPEPNPSSRGSPAGASSRKSERKRRPRVFTDSAALAAVTAPATAPPGSGVHGAVQKLWSDADQVALLTGAAAFRARTGHVPRLLDMGALFDSIRGSLSPHLDQAKVYYKLKRLKSKFLNAAPAAAAGPHDRLVRDLCNKVWGAHLVPPAEDDAEADEGGANERRTVPDAAAMLPVVTEVLDGYWKTNGRALSGVSLEKGLSLLGTEDARSVEAKWRRQLDAEVRTQMRRHDLAKEVYGLLIDAIKGLGP